MNKYIGDFRVNAMVVHHFDTNDDAGASITIATDGTLRVYKGTSTTERTSANGITFVEDHDSFTGTHSVAIDTSDNSDAGFFVAGNDYTVKRTGMTIDGQTVNATLFSFSIENRSALMPATADRRLVVDASGLGDANMVKSGPTGSGTAQTARDIGGTLGAAGAGLTAVPWNAAWDAEVQSECADALVAYDAVVPADLPSNFATLAINGSGHVVLQDASLVTAKLGTFALAKTTNITGFNDLDAAGVRTAVGLASANLDTQLAAIDDAIDSEVAAILAAVDTEVAAIKAKTDQLTFTSANKIDATLQAAGDVVAAVANKIADHVWRRTLANIRASSNGDSVAFRSPLGAASKLTNQIAVSGSNLIVYEEDDTTSFGTQAITTDAAAEPIVSLNTA